MHANPRDVVHAAIRAIVADPTIGQEKKGGLDGIFVHKFDCVNHFFLSIVLRVGAH